MIQNEMLEDSAFYFTAPDGVRRTVWRRTFWRRIVWRVDLRRKEVTRAWVLEGFRGGSRKNRKIERKVEWMICSKIVGLCRRDNKESNFVGSQVVDYSIDF